MLRARSSFRNAEPQIARLRFLQTSPGFTPAALFGARLARELPGAGLGVTDCCFVV